jgi:hypothetical protein
MGVDFHGLYFLKYARKMQAFGSVATLGRQGIHIGARRVARILNVRNTEGAFGSYCERLLIDHFDACEVRSFDNSDYESADFICDFNAPLLHRREYDTVIDLGSLEHIYNVAQALKNVSGLCTKGGQIVHVLPANNFNGHGFWQFSPELFFSLYSDRNGYRFTQIFIAELPNHTSWFQAQPPPAGERLEFVSTHPCYILVRTVKAAAKVDHTNVQQSDYEHIWEAASKKTMPRITSQDGSTDRKGFAQRLGALARKLSLDGRFDEWPDSLRRLNSRMITKKLALANNPKFRRVTIALLTE